LLQIIDNREVRLLLQSFATFVENHWDGRRKPDEEPPEIPDQVRRIAALQSVISIADFCIDLLENEDRDLSLLLSRLLRVVRS